MSNQIRQWYDRLSQLPGGKFLFSRMVGRMAPYTGSVHPYVEELAEGYARVRMKDRRQLRNHLRSVHAIAMTNLGEVTTGLAMLYGLPNNARGIVTGLSVEYLKKGRGTLIAECKCEPVKNNEKKEYQSTAEIRDKTNDIVAKIQAKWLIGPA